MAINVLLYSEKIISIKHWWKGRRRWRNESLRTWSVLSGEVAGALNAVWKTHRTGPETSRSRDLRSKRDGYILCQNSKKLLSFPILLPGTPVI